jgi:ABC-type transporter Mla subunit MlaD
MSEMHGWIALLLLAVAVGGLIPVFYEAARTLRSARQFFDTTGPKADKVLEELALAANRLNRLGSTLEEEGRRLKPVLDAAADLGDTVSGIRESLRIVGKVVTAVGPALVAGAVAFLSRRAGGSRATADEEAPHES